MYFSIEQDLVIMNPVAGGHYHTSDDRGHPVDFACEDRLHILQTAYFRVHIPVADIEQGAEHLDRMPVAVDNTHFQVVGRHMAPAAHMDRTERHIPAAAMDSQTGQSPSGEDTAVWHKDQQQEHHIPVGYIADHTVAQTLAARTAVAGIPVAGS